MSVQESAPASASMILKALEFEWHLEFQHNSLPPLLCWLLTNKNVKVFFFFLNFLAREKKNKGVRSSVRLLLLKRS